MPHCAAFAGPSGPAFSFSAYLRFLSTISLRVGATLVFTCLDFAGVVPLSVFNTAHSASQGKFLFCVQNEVTPPPKGGGAGYHLSWVGRVGSVRSKLGHAGSTSSFRRRSTQCTAPPQACHRTPEELFEAFLDPCDCVLTPSHLTLFTLRW